MVRVCLPNRSYCGRSCRRRPLQLSQSDCRRREVRSPTHHHSTSLIHHPLFHTMARNRSRSNSTISIANSARAPTASPQLKRQNVAASETIYQNNMTVLRRRDPTITTILDSFSHVCLYHFSGSKWKRLGFEGSMFLVEQYVLPQLALENPCSRSTIAARTLLITASSF